MNEIHEVAAYAMRYWFLLLMALMLFAVVYISVKEYKQRKLVLSEAGKYMGYLEIAYGNDELVGINIAIEEKNSVGSSPKSDIFIDDSSVLKSHALLYLERDRLLVSPLGEGAVHVNGRKALKPKRLKDGDIIEFGSIATILHLREEHDN